MTLSLEQLLWCGAVVGGVIGMIAGTRVMRRFARCSVRVLILAGFAVAGCVAGLALFVGVGVFLLHVSGAWARW